MAAKLSTLPGAAEELAYELLAPLGNRWRHSAGVAARAAELAPLLDLDAAVLVAAAWVHDIGYADPVRVTGFHPLDGARYLERMSWPSPIVGLVAHHSGARFVAAARGLAEALAAYPDEGDEISDALTYADQTVGPDGRRVTTAQRRDEMLHRHGPASWNAKVEPVRRPYLQAVAARVERRLSRAHAGSAVQATGDELSGAGAAPPRSTDHDRASRRAAIRRSQSPSLFDAPTPSSTWS